MPTASKTEAGTWVTWATTAGEAGVRPGPLLGVLDPPNTLKATRATTITITSAAVPQVSRAVGERRDGRVGAGRRAAGRRSAWVRLGAAVRWSLRRGPPPDRGSAGRGALRPLGRGWPVE